MVPALLEHMVVVVESWMDWNTCWNSLVSFQQQKQHHATTLRMTTTTTTTITNNPQTNHDQEKQNEHDMDATKNDFFLHAIQQREEASGASSLSLSSLSSLSLWQSILWKGTCHRAHQLAQRAPSRSKETITTMLLPTRRQRLLAACGVLALVAGFHELVVVVANAANVAEHSEDPEDDPDTPQPRPAAKRLRRSDAADPVVGKHDAMECTNNPKANAPEAKKEEEEEEDVMDRLIRVANQQAAFTRCAAWRRTPPTFSHHHHYRSKKNSKHHKMTTAATATATTTTVSSSRIDSNLTRDEVLAEVDALGQELVPLIAAAAAVAAAQKNETNRPPIVDEAWASQVGSTVPTWQRNLLQQIILQNHRTMTPLELLRGLAAAMEDLYHATLDQWRHQTLQQPFSPYSIPYMDEARVADMDGSFLKLICDCAAFPNRRPDVAVVAAAAQGRQPGLAHTERLVTAWLDYPPPEQQARAVTPPVVVTESMRLNEWTVALLYLELVKPSRNLHSFLDAASKKQATHGGGGGSGGGATAGVGTTSGASGGSPTVSQFPTAPTPMMMPDPNQPQWQQVMVPLLNRTVLRLSQENMAEKPTRIASVTVDPFDGRVVVVGEFTPDKQLCKAVVALYYHALEAILFCETVRRRGDNAHPSIIFSDSFHKALLSCCILCVLKAVGSTQKLRSNPTMQYLQIYPILLMTESNPFDFFKVVGSFLTALTTETARGQLGSPLIFALPRSLIREVKDTESKILDSLLWIRDPNFPDCMAEKMDDLMEKTTKGKVQWWPPPCLADEDGDNELSEDAMDAVDTDKPPQKESPTSAMKEYADYRFISYVFRQVLANANKRIQSMCEFLGIPPHCPVAEQTWRAFRYLLRHHTDVVYDRHMDHFILCCLYGVSKTIKYKPELLFQRVIDAYVVVRGQELGDVTCQRIVRQIKLSGADDAPIGNIIMLYNMVFVPTMKQYLLHSKSLLDAAKWLEQGGRPRIKPGAGPNVRVNFTSKGNVIGHLQEQLRGATNGTQTIIRFGKPQAAALTQANELMSSNGDEREEAAK